MPEDPKPKPKIPNIITAADSKPIGNKLYDYGIAMGGQSQSKYDPGSLVSDLSDINRVRARNQGFWDAAGNTAVNLFTTLVGQTAEALGAFSDPIYNWFADTDLKLNEGLSGVGQSISQYGQEQNPIYYDPNAKGFGAGADYVMSHLPSVVSAATMLIPGWGLARGAGLAARAARLGAMGEKALAVAVGSWGMRHAENRMESAQVYNQIMQEGIKGFDSKYDKLGYEEIENGAKVGAATTYANNWANIVFDAAQMAMLFTPIKGFSGWNKALGKESNLAQVMKNGYEITAAKGLLADASRLNKAGLWSMDVARPFLEQLTEGAEEAWNHMSQQEGQRAANIAMGIEQDDGTNIFQRIGNYTKDWATWDAAIWGVIGGVTFQAGGQKLNQLGAKAGWWADTTQKGAMLADLKQRSDIITRGYKALANPALNEYDKALIKGQMLFNLVKSNKSRESLDMLLEDIENPKMLEHFSQMMGLKPEEVKAEFGSMKEDIEYINNQMNSYMGETAKGWFGKAPVQHTGLGLEEKGTMDTPEIRRFRYDRTKDKVPFVYDPRAALQLAYNDYSVRIKDRINKAITAEMMGLQQKAFEGMEMDANGQAVFNTWSDMSALALLLKHETNELADRKKRGLSETFIKSAEAKVKKVNDLFLKRKKTLEALQETMDANFDAGTGATSYTQAHEYALNKGANGTMGRHSGLKTMYFNNLLDKEEALFMNNRILEDPKRYITDYMSSNTANTIFEDLQKSEAERVKQEQADIDTALSGLEDQNNKTYTDAHKRNADTIDTALSAMTTDEEKLAYLTKQLEGVAEEFGKHTTDGKFKRANMVEFSSEFDTELYTQLKARENALRDAMKPYVKEAPKSKRKDRATRTAEGEEAKTGTTIMTEEFDENSDSHYYQGMLWAFGNDGKGGKWKLVIHGGSGLLKEVTLYNFYQTSTTEIEKILDNYSAAKKAGDPDAIKILQDAEQYARISNWKFDITKSGDAQFAVLQQELDAQEKELARLHEDIHKPIVQSIPWQNIAGNKTGASKLENILSGKKGAVKETEVFARIPDNYPEVYKFALSLIEPYKDSIEFAEGQEAVNAKIAAELARAKAAFDAEKAKNKKPSSQPITQADEAIRQIMDQTNIDISTIAEYPSSIHFSNSDKLFPGSHAEKVTEYKVAKDGSWVNVYSNGKQSSNNLFNKGYTIYIGKDGKTMNGFIQRGMKVVFRYTGKMHGAEGKAEKEIRIENEQGDVIGYLDKSSRIQSNIQTLNRKLKNPDITAEERADMESTIKKYNQLIPYYRDIRKSFTTAGQTMPARVADKITDTEGNVESGGVRFGNVIETQGEDGKPLPIDIHSAFGLDDINQENGVIMALYHNGEFYVKGENTDNLVSAETRYGKISIPKFAKNPKVRWGKGTHDGGIFALIPTNTFDQSGNRIYMSVKQYTRKITNVKMTSDGTFEGKTVPEQILDIITNPDAHSEEFRMLAASVKVQFKKDVPIAHPDNDNARLSFYSTEKLLQIFNRVIYTYDSSPAAKKFPHMNYQHHIGISVFNAKKDEGNQPSIRFDLSNDLSTRNTYVINLYDEQGNFNPTFGKTSKTGAQLATPEEKAGLSPIAAAGQVDVDVKAEIVKRLRQKLTAVDIRLLSRTSAKKEFKALVLNKQGQLIEQAYDSYLHYLADKQILESTVQGVDFDAIDPVTNEKKKGRTYFDNQSFWFDTSVADEQKPPDDGPSSSHNNSAGGGTAGSTTRVEPITKKEYAAAKAEIKKRKKADVDAIVKEEFAGKNFFTVTYTAADGKVVKERFNTKKAANAFLTEKYDAELEALDAAQAKTDKEEKQPGAVKTFPIEEAIRTSLGLDANGHIIRPGDKDNTTGKYIINGKMYERVSDVLDPTKKAWDGNAATDAGTAVDKAVKAILDGETPDLSKFTPKAAEQITKGVEDFKKYLASKGQQIVGTSVVLYSTVKGMDGVERNIAGETDILAVDKNGRFFVYDFKTSKDSFSKQTYESNNTPTGVSRATSNHNQLSAYSALIEHMTGAPALGIGVVPFTLNYAGEQANLMIDSVLPYDNILFPDTAIIPQIPTEGSTTGLTSRERADDNEQMTDDDWDGMPAPFMSDLGAEPGVFWMSDLDDLDPTIPSFIDVGRFRDSKLPYHHQRAYEDYTSQAMLDALYKHQMVDKNKTRPTYEKLLELTRDEMERKVAASKKLLRIAARDGGITRDGIYKDYTESMMKDKERQIEQLQDLINALDETADFIGYGKAGFMILSANQIIEVDINLDEVIVKGPEDASYTIRYAENYSVRINPKATIGMQAKVFLSRIPELHRDIVKGEIKFRQVSNMFGLNQYLPLDGVLDILYIDFEGVAPERFMDKLDEMNTNNPVVRSVMNTLKDMEKHNPERALQIKHQMSVLLKQRRDMKFLKVGTREDGTVDTAKVIDAARMGVKNNIIKEWENLFRSVFTDFFDVKQRDDDLRSTNHTAAMKPMSVTYTEKGVGYDTAEFKLPADYDESNPTPWQVEWLYNQLKAIEKGDKKKRLSFTFENGKVVIDGKTFDISETTMAQMLLLFNQDNFILDKKHSHWYAKKYNEKGEEIKPKYREDTILKQVAANISFFSREALTGVTHGDPNAPKDSKGYAPIYYKIMADQMKRLGIQLSENADQSWTVLQDLNSNIKHTKKRKFAQYDSRPDTFHAFITDKVTNRIVTPLTLEGAFSIGEQEYMSEDDGEYMETMKTINVENPFGRSLSGLDPFAKHARPEWKSYINSTIRSGAGNLEYTNTDPNGLSTMMTKLKDGANGYLEQVYSTPMGRHNIFVQNLVNSKDALNAFTMHYVDAGKVDNFSVIEPDNLNAAKSHLLIWNNYYNNEGKNKTRNKGGYITTHSDSSIMPIFAFDKQQVQIKFVETIAADGTRNYKLQFTEEDTDGNENLAYKHLYGNFLGELTRIKEAFEVWEDIQRHGNSNEDPARIEYAFKNYQQHMHFNFDKGKLSIGNGIHLLQFGSTMSAKNNSKIYLNESKSGLLHGFFDEKGDATVKLKEHFAKFVNDYLNELFDDAYGDLAKMGDGFFTRAMTKYNPLRGETKSTKTQKLTIKPTLIDSTATEAMRSLFHKLAVIVNPDGAEEGVTERDTPIEKTYTLEQLKKEGMTEAEAKLFMAEKDKVRAEDTKAATYSELFMRYMVGEMAINHAIFYQSLFTIMADPASFEFANDYKKFKDQFEKRMKGPVSPGKVDYFADNEPVRVLAFEDVLSADIKISLDDVKLSEHETEFIDEFKKRFPKEVEKANGKLPARIFDYMSFWSPLSAADRAKAWPVIKGMMESKITDGGSYISTKEWLYRGYRKGAIDKAEYFKYLKAYNEGTPIPAGVNAKILKYVYAGNNIVGANNSFSNIYSYIKDSQMPLVPGMFKNTALDEIRKQVEEIEKREYADYDQDEPTPGIVLLPRSSFKTGFSSFAKIYDEEGQPTQELLNTRVLQLNRGWLREQIQAPEEKDRRATITAQGNVLADLNAVAYHKFGMRPTGGVAGSSLLPTFSRYQTAEKLVVYDEEGNEVEIDESGTGISSNVMQESVVRVITELAKRRLTDKMYELGLKRVDQDVIIDSLTQFLSKMKSQAMNQFGIGSIAASYLNVIKEGKEEVLPIPVSFTTAGKRIQSVLLSELKEIFYKLTLPGGAFTQFSSAGIHTMDKSKFTADSQLKSYRVHVHKSKVYDTAEEANKDFAPEEIHKAWNSKTKIVEYYTFEPAEAIVPWTFKDAEGNYLDYDTYVNEDGTPKVDASGKPMIDPRLLEFSAFRVPNTGPNSSIRMRMVKFSRPGYGDGIATAPEVVAIIGADFDYDKLYSYMYNYKIGKDGKLEKIESVLHSSQDNQDFTGAEAHRQYAQNQLMKEAEYRELKYRLKQLKASKIALDDNQFEFMQASIAKGGGKASLADLQNMKGEIATKTKKEADAIEAQIALMEDEYMLQDEFDSNYAKASIYEKQSVSALENALIDRFNIMLGDFKTLKQMTSPTSSAWLQSQLEDKNIPVAGGAHISINEALNDNKYHSISSFNSFNNSRLANAAADRVIAMAANAQISQYQGQRWNLHINMAGYEPKYRNAHQLRFNNSSGRLKMEEDPDRTNSTYAGIYNPYKLKTDEGVIYEPPEDGRYRLDRVWVIDDSGNRVNISTVIQSILQAALDHQKNPLIDKASISPNTLNAAVALARLGYIDEIVPLLKQESVTDFVTRTSNYYNIEFKDKRTKILMQVASKFTESYGYDEGRLWNIFNGLEEGSRTAPIFMQTLMDILDKDKKATLNTADLNSGVAQRAGLIPKDENYNLRQLEALRSYIVADTTGKQLFAVQNATAAYTRGLKTSFAAMDVQNLMFQSLFNYNEVTGEYQSSTPLIGGLHRISSAWAYAVGRPKEYKPTMMSFGQFYGLLPSLSLLKSLQGDVFTEFTYLFDRARKEAFRTSMGMIPDSGNIATIGAKEYERVFNKINTNMVSFLFSNPLLFSNEKFMSPADYAMFEKHGIELMTRPHEGIPYDPNSTLFNSPKSLAKEFMELADTVNPSTGNKYIVEYDVLEALKGILNVSYKTPSSVVYNNTFGYQENVSHRLAMSVAEMLKSTDARVNGMAKKLIMYSFMTGGITSPTSFVQFIPPQVLREIGFDVVLRSTLKAFADEKYADEAIKTFMIQYYQHHPFELKAELDLEKDMKLINGSYEQKNPETGEVYMEIQTLSRQWFQNKYIFRSGNKLFINKDGKTLVRIDNLGMSKWHRNEYHYNTAREAGTSLYAHNITNESRVVTQRLEVKGEMSDTIELPTKVKELMKRLSRPVFDRIMDRPTDLMSVVTDIEQDKTNITAGAVVSFLRPILNDMEIKIEYSKLPVDKYGQYIPPAKGTIGGTIIINTEHPRFKGLTSGNPKEFDMHKFMETIAHEATHAVTIKVIRDVLSGKETDPAKVKAVHTLQALMARSMDVIEQDKDISKKHHLLKALIDGATKDSADAKENDMQAEARKLGEFVAYAFSNERFQEDMNKVNFKKKSWWKNFLEAIMKALGLNINEDEAQGEIDDIKKRLVARQDFITPSKESHRRTVGISEPVKRLETFSGLHVALREIIALSVEVKRDIITERGAAKFAAEVERQNKQKGDASNKNYMTDLFKDVDNFDPTWSEEMMNEYHKAALNRNIIC